MCEDNVEIKLIEWLNVSGKLYVGNVCSYVCVTSMLMMTLKEDEDNGWRQSRGDDMLKEKGAIAKNKSLQ